MSKSKSLDAFRDAIRRESIENIEDLIDVSSRHRERIANHPLNLDSTDPEAAKQLDEAFARLSLFKDYLSELVRQKTAVLWGRKQGVEKSLREMFAPLPELNLSVDSGKLEDYYSMYGKARAKARARREDYFDRDQLLAEMRWDIEYELYGYLGSFLSALNKLMRTDSIKKLIGAAQSHDDEEMAKDAREALQSKHERLLRHDQIALDQANFEIKRLCKFCWRPVDLDTPRGECCELHSQSKNPGGYKQALRDKMSTPVVLVCLLARGELVKDAIISHCKCDACQAIPTLEQMRDNWSQAVSSGLAQSFIDKLTGNTYRELKHATAYATWAEFFDDLCRAFEVTMPDDVVFLAHALPHAIAEVKRERERFAKKAKLASIAKEIEELAATDGARGAQRRTAARLNVSDATVSKRLKKVRSHAVAA
jgi:hypothetical protein